MLQRLFDKLDELGRGSVMLYLGAFFGGIYLVVQLVVGVEKIPNDFELTPAAYLAFLGGGGGLLSVGTAILKGKRAEAGVSGDDDELARLHAQESTSPVGSPGPEVVARPATVGGPGEVGEGDEFPPVG